MLFGSSNWSLMMLTGLILGPVNPGYLVKLVPVRFLQSKIVTFPFVTDKHLCQDSLDYENVFFLKIFIINFHIHQGILSTTFITVVGVYLMVIL
jgi:hypothetical protein